MNPYAYGTSSDSLCHKTNEYMLFGFTSCAYPKYNISVKATLIFIQIHLIPVITNGPKSMFNHVNVLPHALRGSTSRL